MSHLHYPDREHLVLNRIDNSVSTLTDTVSFLSGQFFMARRTRVLGERCDALKDILEVFLRDCPEVFFDRFLEIDFIFGHLFSIS